MNVFNDCIADLRRKKKPDALKVDLHPPTLIKKAVKKGKEQFIYNFTLLVMNSMKKDDQ